jgi:(p)ppGpp synthase/HD superfamily hydrolase
MKMNKNLEKIRAYLINKGVSEQKVDSDLTSSVYLAMMIMEYAHRNQKRENGEDYANHPYRCLLTYRHLIGIGLDGDGLMDKDLLYENNIPFDGVQEVLLLHDVVEDTEFTLDEVRDIYVDCGFESYFDMYIKSALKCITHDEAVDYSDYIKIVLKNPISALVKIIDTQDNLRILDLIKFNKDKYHRAEKYLHNAYIINKKYHFVENIENYKKQFKEDAE